VSVLCSGLLGKSVALKRWVSQAMGMMFVQSVPAGQQMADWPLLNGVHVVPAPQQKSAGSPRPHCVNVGSKLHVAPARATNPMPSAAALALEKAMAPVDAEDIRSVAANTRNSELRIAEVVLERMAEGKSIRTG
jgi:hypothetical protein